MALKSKNMEYSVNNATGRLRKVFLPSAA